MSEVVMNAVLLKKRPLIATVEMREVPYLMQVSVQVLIECHYGSLIYGPTR